MEAAEEAAPGMSRCPAGGGPGVAPLLAVRWQAVKGGSGDDGRVESSADPSSRGKGGGGGGLWRSPPLVVDCNCDEGEGRGG